MFWSQVKTVVVLFLAAGTMAGVGAVGLGQRAGPQAEVKKEQAKPEESPEEFIGRTKRELLKVHPGWAFPEPNQGDEAVVPPRLAPPIPKLADETLKEALASTRILEKMKPLLQARLDAAEIEAETRWMEFVAGRGTLNIMFGAYERLLRSELAINPDRDFQIAALEANLKGSQEILKVNKARYEAGRIAVHDLAESQFYYEDAKIRLEQAKEAAR